jgi:transketolase
MTEATIRIPGNIDIKKVSDEIVYKAFSIAIEKKRKEIQKELRRVESKIKRFEKKYKTSFEEYEKSMGDSFQHHNDWMDWSFLMEDKKQLVEELQNFETL